MDGPNLVDIVYGCSDGQVSYEPDELGHGLFTHGLTSVLEGEKGTMDIDYLSGMAGDYIRTWCRQEGKSWQQDPHRYYRASQTNKIVLQRNLPTAREQRSAQAVAVATLVECPLCSKYNEPTQTFRCRQCGSQYLCLSHQDPATFTCLRCVTPTLAKQQAQEQKLQELARIEQKQKEREKLDREGPRGKHWTEPVTGMEFVWIPGGSFEMGDIWGDGDDDEKPVHTVAVPGFYMGKYPVTQAEYKKVMGGNPARFNNGPRYPVEGVNWENMQWFIQKLQKRSGKQFALPSEAMWEYAARGGRDDKWSGTGDASCLRDYAWIGEGQTSPVDKRQPNGFGLHDMSGNVWEWCSDIWYDDYSGAPDDGSARLQGSGFRVIRSGSCYNTPEYARTVFRSRFSPVNRNGVIGFRLCLTG